MTLPACCEKQPGILSNLKWGCLLPDTKKMQGRERSKLDGTITRVSKDHDGVIPLQRPKWEGGLKLEPQKTQVTPSAPSRSQDLRQLRPDVPQHS